MKNHKYTILVTCLVTGLFSSCGLFRKHKNVEEYNFSADSLGRFDSLAYEIPVEAPIAWEPPVETVRCYTQIPYTEFKGETTKYWDLISTRLNVTPDFEKRILKGTAELQLKPHFYNQDSLLLDAVAMKIDSVIMIAAKPKMLKYRYEDTAHLVVYFNETITRENTVKLLIHYTAMPYEYSSSGNSAITDNKGIYFINHDLSETGKPRQLWTQGETQSSSHWFPTLDAPNQKTTWEISVTIPDTMISLSNGKFIQSKPQKNRLKTETWKQEQPNAPYLCMLAVGDWSVYKTKWRNKEVNYYVEKKYLPYVNLNFGHTPEMIEFFSNYTGVDFAWDKFSQVVVRDFVSGAMENTTAVVHMEGLQQTPRQHVDQSYEDYVSHELFHQWFGDLVTCESWAHLTVNESWATYGQFLWNEYKYGKDKAEEGLQYDEESAYYSFLGGNKTLTRHDYKNNDAGDMFDNISYQKGACVLHMLRNLVGEEAFKEGIKLYLTRNKFKTAETSNLRMAFEEVSGRDLNWFFNQWYYSTGHPQIELRDWYVDSVGDWMLRIKQVQIKSLGFPENAFAFPVKIKYEINGKTEVKEIFVNSRDTTINFDLPGRPSWWAFDSDNALLAEVELDKYFYTEEQDYYDILLGVMNSSLSNSNKMRCYKMARQLNNGEFDKNNADHMKVFEATLGKSGALKINNKHLLYSALYFIDENVYKADTLRVGNALLDCAMDKRFAGEVRGAALKSYLNYTGNTKVLDQFLNDSSLYMSVVAFVYLPDTAKQLSMVRKALIDKDEDADYASGICSSLMNKLLNRDTKLELMNLAVQNPEFTIKQYKRLINNFLPYDIEEGQSLPSETELAKIKETTKNKNFIKAMEETEKQILETHQD